MRKTAWKGKKVVKETKTKLKKEQPVKKGQTRKARLKPAKVFIYALALAALGGGSYLVYDRIKKRKQGDSDNEPSGNNRDSITINNSLPVSYSSTISRLFSSASDNFPLKRGSKGSRVTRLQQALAKNASITVDGQFGPQTASALKSAGYPQTVDEILLNKITGASGGSVQVIFNPSSLASSLYQAAQGKNLEDVLSVLKQMKTVADYSSVNDYYKKQSFISKTIVTDLLEYAFKGNEEARAQIQNEFKRMGLKMSGSGTWSLQGIRLYRDLVTIRQTVVTDSKNNRIPVRKNTILGDEVEVANGMTWFKSIDNSVLKVPTQDVKYA